MRLGRECERILERGGPGADRPSAGTAEYEGHVLAICNQLIALGREEVLERDIAREGPHKITLLDLDDLPARVAEAIRAAGPVSEEEELAEAITCEVVRAPRVARELADDADGAARKDWKRRILRSLVANGEKGKAHWGLHDGQGPKELAVLLLNGLGLRPAAAAAARKLAKKKDLTSARELHVLAVGVQRGNRDLIDYAVGVLGLSNRNAEQLLHDINEPARQRFERHGKKYIED